MKKLYALATIPTLLLAGMITWAQQSGSQAPPSPAPPSVPAQSTKPDQLVTAISDSNKVRIMRIVHDNDQLQLRLTQIMQAYQAAQQQAASNVKELKAVDDDVLKEAKVSADQFRVDHDKLEIVAAVPPPAPPAKQDKK